ncbi:MULTISPECIES: (2Fe-2S)-binding protein [unclassified Paenibacillus]|uniref:(2Fe-2S)-binding protein n=1 Tax=unclassified Paenibacillus TaxID=185978 RepID=UPI001AEB5AC3|nr:carbon-monoxide dehydrogenase small subunit [Paenibacillus sp. PvP091]MBP1170154.1 carbon-monoxide dehydrogenase small subunit [Paenibacillus sp. PvR098]MBP2441182.1 carbon-monoxide dehydrogenase small subunit [Paenibacillus sp. PvP052]
MTQNNLKNITVTVNGKEHSLSVEPRMLLSDVLRDELGLTGTHVGCEHGICGACTVMMDERPVRSCLVFGVQADQAKILTVEGLSNADDTLHPLQEAFREKHGLQCGFCTPGFLITACHFLEENPHPSREEIREGISGNLCRCTGYQNIVDAVEMAAEMLSKDKKSETDQCTVQAMQP